VKAEREALLNHINKGHHFTMRTTDHIHNVPLVDTHDLVECDCRWLAWLRKTR
jgi:hypothetical protein